MLSLVGMGSFEEEAFIKEEKKISLQISNVEEDVTVASESVSGRVSDFDNLLSSDSIEERFPNYEVSSNGLVDFALGLVTGDRSVSSNIGVGNGVVNTLESERLVCGISSVPNSTSSKGGNHKKSVVSSGSVRSSARIHIC